MNSPAEETKSLQGEGKIMKTVFLEDYWNNVYHLLVTHQVKGDPTIFLIEY